MHLGLDLGTSAVKVVLLSAEGALVAEAEAPLAVSRPRPLWSEQDPEDWWRALVEALGTLRATHAAELGAVAAIGLSGQMHGATLLDAGDRVLRPAILWNDGRSGDACRELERRVPALRAITGNAAMPGFTAPKLVWLERAEPDVFAMVAHVLLPKDYLRLRLSGERATDCSDASGTLWLDVGARVWSDEIVAATGLRPSAMPRLHEGSEVSATLRADVAAELGLGRGIPIAGGAGDQAAGAAGAGVVRPGEAFLSLGTSGVYFVAGDRFAPDPTRGVHAFCHCLPGTWHQMAVILSAASCLAWVTSLTGRADEAALLREIDETGLDAPGDEVFLPYLSGERTPHDDPRAKGVFFGLDHDTTPARLGRAVLEGVAFALADGQDALAGAQAPTSGAGDAGGELSVIGGGARSLLWGRVLASVLDRRLVYRSGAELGPAAGAARLARLSVTGESPDSVCVPPPAEQRVAPEPELARSLAPRRARFRALYPDLRRHWDEPRAE